MKSLTSFIAMGCLLDACVYGKEMDEKDIRNACEGHAVLFERILDIKKKNKLPDTINVSLRGAIVIILKKGNNIVIICIGKDNTYYTTGLMEKMTPCNNGIIPIDLRGYK